MKKLLILALVATIAMPAHAWVSDMADGYEKIIMSPVRVVTAPFRYLKKAAKAVAPGASAEIKDLAEDIGGQLSEIVTVPAQAIKDVSIKAATKVKNTAQTVRDSEVAQDAADVFNQLFIGFPTQVGQDVKDGFNASVDATKTVGRKIADSRFVAKVKDANQVVVDASKKAATRVKDAAKDVMNSEAVEDTKDVFGQFAEAPREAWTSIAAFFTAVKQEIID